MKKKLYKSNTNKVLTGTCGGIGEYFNIDPTIVRLILVVSLFFAGTGILVYIVAALIIPNTPIEDFEEMKEAKKDYNSESKNSNNSKSSDEEFDSYFKK